jgi:hypothetical protein
MLATISYFITVSSYLFPNFPADVPMGFGTFPVLGKTTTDKLILAKMGMLFAVVNIIDQDTCQSRGSCLWNS